MTHTLEALVGRVGPELEHASAEDVLRWAGATFGARFAITASMGDTVLAHLAARVLPGVDVLFLDTGYHFAETLGTRDAVAASYDVNLVNVTPERTVRQQDAIYGPNLHRRDPDLCCALRKVAPLHRAMTRYDAWGTGLRRSETPGRADAPVVSWDTSRGKVKVNPLAGWGQDAIDDYVQTHGVLLNPLLADGYPSIGCAPCTRRVAPGEDPRSGRWAGMGKTECGIHTPAAAARQAS